MVVSYGRVNNLDLVTILLSLLQEGGPQEPTLIESEVALVSIGSEKVTLTNEVVIATPVAPATGTVETITGEALSEILIPLPIPTIELPGRSCTPVPSMAYRIFGAVPEPTPVMPAFAVIFK
jgi:hypothetical protein